MNGPDTASGSSRLGQYALIPLILVSCGTFLWGAVGEPQRIAANLLVISYGLLCLGLGGAVLLALLSVTGARWSNAILPAAEKLTRLLPVGAIGMALVLILFPSLYPWTSATAENGSRFQAFWLSRPFFLLRSLAYLAMWQAMVFLLVQTSAHRRSRIAAAFLVIFAITSWLASVDWIMSLEPRWNSTVFGVYHFAGMFLTALAAVIVVVIWFDRRGDFGNRLTPDHLRDLGTLLFSFSSFWMYIWFCQYLLIWFVNNPDEAEYYVLRQQVQWLPLFLLTVTLNWGVPFAVLLFRSAKENRYVLLVIAVTILIGRWLDVYLMVLPPVVGGGAGFVASDAGLFVVGAALAALVVAWGGTPELKHVRN